MIKHKKNKGAILVIVILTVVILLLIGMTFIFWLRIESRSATQKRTATKDIFYAELGSEKTVHRLQNDSVWAAPFTDGVSGPVVTYTLEIDGVPIQVTVQEIP